MKAINTGNTFRIYSDHLKVYDALPAGSYMIKFSETQGFFLEEYSEIEIHEDKIYGVHPDKVEKCLNTFKRTNRSLGVMLSGAKGIGKSLFAKLLSRAAIERGFPLIVADKFIPGIASFIEEIEQEAVVLFDEFDKTFGQVRTANNEASPQTALLSLFDGISAGKKLYVITCNDTQSLSDYLINRPGRFHYHFRFEYPADAEMAEYLRDKIDEEYWGEIQKVVAFSRKFSLNYDHLRAIAFEIQGGETFESAIADLNITNDEDCNYKLVLHFVDGSSMTCHNHKMNMFCTDEENHEFCRVTDSIERKSVEVNFNPSDAKFDAEKGCQIIPADKLDLSCGRNNADVLRTSKPDYLAIYHKVNSKRFPVLGRNHSLSELAGGD